MDPKTKPLRGLGPTSAPWIKRKISNDEIRALVRRDRSGFLHPSELEFCAPEIIASLSARTWRMLGLWWLYQGESQESVAARFNELKKFRRQLGSFSGNVDQAKKPSEDDRSKLQFGADQATRLFLSCILQNEEHEPKTD